MWGGRKKKKISVDDDKNKKKTTGCGADIHVSGHMFLCPVLSRYKVLLIDVIHDECVYFLNAFLKKKRKHHDIKTLSWDCWGWDNWLQMYYVLYCHKSSTRRGKGGHHGNKLCLKKLMQWGVSALVCTDPAEPKGTANGEETARNEKVLQWVRAPHDRLQLLRSWLSTDNGGRQWELVSARRLMP